MPFFFKAIDCYKAADEYSIIPLVYNTGSASTPIHYMLAYLEQQLNEDGGMPQLTCAVGEQQLLRKLLEHNSTCISSTYAPDRRKYENDFKVSFMVPTGPLSGEDIGRITKTTGCELCGKRAPHKCSRCKTANYCSAGTNSNVQCCLHSLKLIESLH